MDKRGVVCAVLLGLSGVSGCLGYLRTRPTVMERFAVEAGRWAASVNPAERAKVDEYMAELLKERIRRGLPLFLVAGAAGVAGIGALGKRNRR